MKINPENYIGILGWMRTELELKGNDLLVYAIIYGFSQSEQGEFHGSLQYLADWCGATKQGIMKNLENLINKGYIIKNEQEIKGIKICSYHTTKFTGIKLSLTNNIYTYNTIESIDNRESIDTRALGNQNVVDFLGSMKKAEPKQSLYDKCALLIYDFTTNENIRKGLFSFLNICLENAKEGNRPFYTSNMKGKLNQLKKLPEKDWEEIVNRTVENGWLNFFELDTKNTKNKFNEPISAHNESYYDEDYMKRQEEWREEMAKHGKRTKF